MKVTNVQNIWIQSQSSAYHHTYQIKKYHGVDTAAWIITITEKYENETW